MNPFLVAFLALCAVLAVLLVIGGLEKVGIIGELPRWHPVALAAACGALIGFLCSIFVVAPIFLSLLLGGFALLALHYRGDGRWPELGSMLVACGAVLAILWGSIVVLTVAGMRTDVDTGLTVPVFFGVGVLILSLGAATLVLRPGRPTPE
jgi:hypothetical protein